VVESLSRVVGKRGTGKQTKGGSKGSMHFEKEFGGGNIKEYHETSWEGKSGPPKSMQNSSKVSFWGGGSEQEKKKIVGGGDCYPAETEKTNGVAQQRGRGTKRGGN